MLPEGFIKRIKTQKYVDTASLLRALAEPSPVSIRINSRKWNRKPLNSEPVPWTDKGYYLKTRPSFTPDPLFHAGCYYPQEASGMFIERVIKQFVDVSEPERVLDLCGAPGGKSIIIADMLRPDSLLVSNEVIKSRASILAETLTKWGTGNVIVTNSDPSAFSRLPGYFDVILVDAPCSGEGMFRTVVARNEWSESNAGHCSERQRRILMDVWPALKENGVLIYSTCTFNPDENEENIKWLVDKHKAESVMMDVSDIIGITEIDYQSIRGYGFYPDKIRGEGFFISLVRKTEKQGFSAYGKIKMADFSPARNELQTVRKWSGLPDERLLKWGEEIWGLPCSMDNYINLFQNLRIVKAGTKICTVKNDDYLPSHELAMSDLFSTDIFPSLELDYEEAIAFLRRDNLRPKTGQQGWTLVKFMGINIGLVKNLGNRLNNYYPVEWRIRMELPQADEITMIKWE